MFMISIVDYIQKKLSWILYFLIFLTLNVMLSLPWIWKENISLILTDDLPVIGLISMIFNDAILSTEFKILKISSGTNIKLKCFQWSSIAYAFHKAIWKLEIVILLYKKFRQAFGIYRYKCHFYAALI